MFNVAMEAYRSFFCVWFIAIKKMRKENVFFVVVEVVWSGKAEFFSFVFSSPPGGEKKTKKQRTNKKRRRALTSGVEARAVDLFLRKSPAARLISKTAGALEICHLLFNSDGWWFDTRVFRQHLL